MRIAHRFIGGMGVVVKSQSVTRTAEFKSCEKFIFQSSSSRTLVQIAPPPSAEALGYFHSVRFADVENDFCSKAAATQWTDSFLYEDQKALSVSGHEVTVSSFLLLNSDIEKWPRLPSDDFLPDEL